MRGEFESEVNMNHTNQDIGEDGAQLWLLASSC